MAPVDRRVKLWAWLVRQQGSVGTKTEAEVIAMQSRHIPANGVANRIFGTIVPGTEVTNRAITGPPLRRAAYQQLMIDWLARVLTRIPQDVNGSS